MVSDIHRNNNFSLPDTSKHHVNELSPSSLSTMNSTLNPVFPLWTNTTPTSSTSLPGGTTNIAVGNNTLQPTLIRNSTTTTVPISLHHTLSTDPSSVVRVVNVHSSSEVDLIIGNHHPLSVIDDSHSEHTSEEYLSNDGQSTIGHVLDRFQRVQKQRLGPGVTVEFSSS